MDRTKITPRSQKKCSHYFGPEGVVEYTLLFLTLPSSDLQLCSLVLLRAVITGFCQLLPLFLACLRMDFRETLGFSWDF